MSKYWKPWLSGVVGLAMALPIAGFVLAEDEAEEDDRPRAERRMDDEDEPNRDAQRESAARDDDESDDVPRAERRMDDEDESNRDVQRESAARDDDDADEVRATDREERVPRSVRRDRNQRNGVRVNVQDEKDAPDARSSPSDLPPRDLPPGPAHAAPRQHVQGNCCCSSGPVVYSQNGNGYRSARANNGGAYRSFSYQGGDEGGVVEAAPAPVYNDSYPAYRGRSMNGANWNRSNEHETRNFSGSYGSRATLHHGR